MREKFQSKQIVNVFRKINTVPKATKLYNNNITFVSPIHTFSSAGNIIAYTPIQGSNKEKYFNHIIYKGKMQTLRPFLPIWTASFPSIDGKSSGPIRQKWTSKWLLPRRHNH